MSYKSDNTFQMWSYSVSHSVLILRSPNNQDGAIEEVAAEVPYNIDVEFEGVAYLDLPDLIHGIEIQEIQQDIPNKFSIYSTSIGYRIFQIKSFNQYYYIVAGSYRVGKNTWLNEDRTKNIFLEHDEILAES